MGQLVGIDLGEMMAFGDDLNDYDMIAQCGTGVAMGNALLEIKEIADDITDSNDEGGVTRYIEKIGCV